MRRRRQIQEHFENCQRYFSPPTNRPGDLPFDPELLKRITQWIENAQPQAKPADTSRPGQSTDANRADPNRAAPRPVQDTMVRQNPPDVRVGLRDASGNVRWFSADEVNSRVHDALGLPPGTDLRLVSPRLVMAAILDSLRQLSAEGDYSGLLQSLNHADQLPPIEVRLPQNEQGRSLMETVVRLFAPADAHFQDGLRALFASPQVQALFQGDKLTQGATTLLPNHQLVGLLLPPSMLTANPELARSLLVAQGLPAALIQNIPDRALAAVFQSLLQNSQLAGKNPLLFLTTVASAFSAAGIPVQQVQNLLLALAQQANKSGIPGLAEGQVTPEALGRWASRLMTANNPQLLGLNQLVQESFGAGITKILNSFIRVFFGGAIMQNQMTWPQAVPNERMLAELGGLFAKQNAKPEGSEKKKRAKRKKGQPDAVDGVEHLRVERKDDIADEPHPPPEMSSIFIDLDSEED